MLLSLSEFVGRFHPLLVHLPIGILFIGILLHWLSASPKYAISAGAVKVVLLAGTFTALLACITGFFISTTGQYDTSLISFHMWAGIGLTAAALLFLQRILTKQNNGVTLVIAVSLLVLIVATGYLGGTLSHEPGYLDLSSKSKTDTSIKRALPPNTQDK